MWGQASPRVQVEQRPCLQLCVQRAVVTTEPALTRSELIAELAASNPHLRVADVELIVTTIFDQITAALARGGRVELRGFGAFTVVSVNEKTKPFFKAGKELRGRLNHGGIKRRT